MERKKRFQDLPMNVPMSTLLNVTKKLDNDVIPHLPPRNDRDVSLELDPFHLLDFPDPVAEG